MSPNILDKFRDARSKISEVGHLVTSDDVDTYRQFREIQDKSHKLNIVLDAWKVQKKEERKLRNIYAGLMLAFLLIQILIVNVGFFLIGLGYLEIERWIANTFIIAVFGEVASMALVIVRYLFPKAGDEFSRIVEKL